MKKKIHKIIVILWLIVGISICVWDFRGLLMLRIWNIHDGLFQTHLETQLCSFLIIISAVGVIMKKRVANPFLIASYLISLLYAFVYVFFGGIEDRGLVYSIVVAIMTMISLIGIVLASSKIIRKEYYS
jgi:membrane-associated HD superfamily phosphohydrolase